MKINRLTSLKKTILIETAWEVCNQVGGVYTVIRSKIPMASLTFKKNYCLTGVFTEKALNEFQKDKIPSKDIFNQAIKELKTEKGWKIHIGRWLVASEPRIVLFEINSYHIQDLFQSYQGSNLWLESLSPLVRDALILGDMNRLFIEKVAYLAQKNGKKVLAHFHEWMSSGALWSLKSSNLKTIFTTHATILGRYLAMNDSGFYDNLPNYNISKEANHFGIHNEVTIESFSAQHADIFTTISTTTGRECEHLLGRKPNFLLPNGLNVERFLALRESQHLYEQCRESINKFIVNHFFPYYSFDLERTLYFFTSGRYEYRNKGFDLTLKSLKLLNDRLKTEKSPITIVCFFITKTDYYSMNPEVLELNGLTQEIDRYSRKILATAQKKFFHFIMREQQTDPLPIIDDMISNHDRLSLKRLMHSWKRKGLPKVTTHNLVNNHTDPILNFLREHMFYNQKENPVKIIYLPEFITASNPLWGIDYLEFIHGCHLGIFPSYYEPWGYTPLECIVSGIPTITSDLAGFGQYSKIIANKVNGITIIPRYSKSEAYSLEILTKTLWKACQIDKRDRTIQRISIESHATVFDWRHLYNHYIEAYLHAIFKE